jgi:hypothetical protein
MVNLSHFFLELLNKSEGMSLWISFVSADPITNVIVIVSYPPNSIARFSLSSILERKALILAAI